MTENDYIAEYIRSKYPTLLNSDYAFWRFGQGIKNIVDTFAKALRGIDWSNIDLSADSEDDEEEDRETNREKLIRLLMDDDDEALFYFMCPYIPGEEGAGCTEPDKAEYQSHCKPCIRKWLDQEATDA